MTPKMEELVARLRYDFLMISRARRLISRSTAARMKSERFSLFANSSSIRSNVPDGNRAGVCSSLILVRPTGRFVPDITNSVNAGTLLISPIDDKPDIT
jgi:hypothetical protein